MIVIEASVGKRLWRLKITKIEIRELYILERLHLLTIKIGTIRGKNGHQRKHKNGYKKTPKSGQQKNVISHLLYSNR